MTMFSLTPRTSVCRPTPTWFAFSSKLILKMKAAIRHRLLTSKINHVKVQCPLCCVVEILLKVDVTILFGEFYSIWFIERFVKCMVFFFFSAVTGASFIVINGALKSSMGLTAKSSIVEDGLMVQIMPEKMEALKAALKNMHDFAIGCGKQGATEPDEVVHIKWVENDTMFNLGYAIFKNKFHIIIKFLK